MKNKSVFFLYLKNNKKNLIFLTILFIIGIVFGIIFVNNSSQMQKEEIYSYVNMLKDNIKSDNIQINKNELLIQSIKENLIFVLIIWFLGYTLFASFLIYAAMIYKGFSIGYTASSIIATLGAKSRNIICNNVNVNAKYYFYTSYFSSL